MWYIVVIDKFQKEETRKPESVYIRIKYIYLHNGGYKRFFPKHICKCNTRVVGYCHYCVVIMAISRKQNPSSLESRQIRNKEGWVVN